jgi:pimeloyl-ACP methyl ester carboxylesterase
MVKAFFGMIWSIIRFILVTLLGLLVLLTVVVIAGKAVNGYRYKIETADGIQESWYFVEGDLKQYVQMRGNDLANPIIIVIHGGPGSNMAYYSYYWQQALESDYTIVHYDQRGSGNTYFHSPEDIEKPTLDLLVNDLDALIDFILEEYGKEKVILMGHAWGAVLGGIYADLHPEKLSALVAVGLMTAPDNIPENAGEALSFIADPNSMITMKHLIPGIFSPYMTLYDMRWLATAVFDWDKFADINSELLDTLSAGDAFMRVGAQYDTPVIIMSGDRTSYSLANAYYDIVVAPRKEFVLIENAGYNPFLDQPEAFAAAVKRALGGNNE